MTGNVRAQRGSASGAQSKGKGQSVPLSAPRTSPEEEATQPSPNLAHEAALRALPGEGLPQVTPREGRVGRGGVPRADICWPPHSQRHLRGQAMGSLPVAAPRPSAGGPGKPVSTRGPRCPVEPPAGHTTGATGTWGMASTVGGERPGWLSASLSSHKPNWGLWKVAWIAQVSGKMGTLTRPPHGWVPVPLQAAGPQASQPAPGLTDGCQGAAVPAVEVGPGFGLTALAAGQDPVAAAAGQEAHPDGAATLVAELEKGNPARGPCSRRPVPAPYSTDPAPGPSPYPLHGTET